MTSTGERQASDIIEGLLETTGLPPSLLGFLISKDKTGKAGLLRKEIDRLLDFPSDEKLKALGIPVVKGGKDEHRVKEYYDFASSLGFFDPYHKTGKANAFRGLAECIKTVSRFYDININVVWELAWVGYRITQGDADPCAAARKVWPVTPETIEGAATVWRYAFGTRTGWLNNVSKAKSPVLSARVRDQLPELSPRLRRASQCRQVRGLHYLCSAPWDMKQLEQGRGLTPLLVFPGTESQAVKVQQSGQMQEDQAVAWAALESVAQAAGITMPDATYEISLAPWEFVAYPDPDRPKLYSEVGADLIKGVLGKLQEQGKGFGIMPMIWRDLWRYLESNADAGDRGLPPGAEEQLETLISDEMPPLSVLAEAIPGRSMGAILSAIELLPQGRGRQQEPATERDAETGRRGAEREKSEGAESEEAGAMEVDTESESEEEREADEHEWV